VSIPQTLEKPKVAAPVISNGVSTYLGIGVTIAGGVAAVIAALSDHDMGTAVAAGAGILGTLAVVSSKAAQAIAVIKAAAQVADPYIDALQELLDEDYDGSEDPDQMVNPPAGATDPDELRPPSV
jgi:hypothetical protein